MRSIFNRTALAFVVLAAAAMAATFYGLRRVQERVAPRDDASLRTVLAQAEWAAALRVQSEPKVEIPIVQIGPAADEHPEMFALLKGGSRYGEARPERAPDLLLNVRYRPRGAAYGRLATFGYDLRTGRLGRGDEWATAPAGFRAWMRRMDARVPHRKYGIIRLEGRKVIAPLPEESKAPK
jgi:hypothetical protein